MVKREKIVVIGRGTALEHEICNLGRSLGHEMLSISESGRPEGDEPWVGGIQWIQQADISDVGDLDDQLKNCFAVIVCDHVTRQDFQADHQVLAQNAQSQVREVAERAEHAGASKFVWVRTTEPTREGAELAERSGDRMQSYDLIYKEAEEDLLARAFRATVFRPTVIFGPGIPMQLEDGSFIVALPMECVAMAALRASLEPDTNGILEREAIEFYGDAMMIQ